ncbi:MAG: DUF2383 domain-containing protein [Tissierellales bacterium]
MENNQETINSLNQLLQGEYMAVEAFNVFISKAEDGEKKQAFQQVQDHHRDNIKTLASYIQNIGGEPEENLGLKGKMADMKMNIQFGSNPDIHDLIEKAIEGETLGINKAEKILRGELDDKSRDMAGEILHRDRRTLEQLKGLI